jgi:sterol desaturase/sphingolipid hydroxylase (fatty acid hydroxylase superfamily)
MTMLTALRDHPLERVTVHGFNALPTALLGVPPEQYFLVQLLLQSLGFVKHSNFSSDWGWFGRWFIQSPRAHRIHHSIQTDHFDTNFATIFQFWDVIFGTSMHVPVSTRIDIGLPDEEVSRGPIRAIFRTTSEFYASLVRSF